jgi:hypothetical protein
LALLCGYGKGMEEKTVAPGPGDYDLVGKMPDPYLSREAWLQICQPVERMGRIDKVKAMKPRNSRERAIAKTQNYYLTRRPMPTMTPEQYDRIKWKKDDT